MVDLVNQLPRGNSPRGLRSLVAAIHRKYLKELQSTRTGRFASGLLFGLMAGLTLLTAGGLLTRAFGYTPLIVVSDSMAPTLNTGDIAITEKIESARVALGDVVTYRGEPGLVTHRIVGLDLTPQGSFYQMKGDANAAQDPFPVSVDQLETRVLYRIPRVGSLVSFIDTPLGIVLMIITPLAILAIRLRKGRSTRSNPEAFSKLMSVGLALKDRMLPKRSRPTKRLDVILEAGSSGSHKHEVQSGSREVHHVVAQDVERELDRQTQAGRPKS